MIGRYLTDDYHHSNWFEPGGWQELALVAAAIKTRVFEHLADTGETAPDLAKVLNLDKRAIKVTLGALEALGYTSSEDGRHTLSPRALERFGNPQAPAYLGWAILHSWRLVERWLTLPAVLETGIPIAGDRFSESVEGFIRAMDVYAGATAAEVADICLGIMPGAASVLDIGGATGTLSKVLAKRGLTATLFDRPGAVRVIEAELARDFPAIELVGGDFNEQLPGGPFSIAFLGNVTHIYGADKMRVLFQRVAAELAPGGLIAILDFVRGRSASAALFGINMLVNTETGGTWTESEYRGWLIEAGFSDYEVRDLAARDQQLILAKKPRSADVPGALVL